MARKSAPDPKKTRRNKMIMSASKRRTTELAAPTKKKMFPGGVKLSIYGEKGTSGLKESSGFVHEAYNAALYWPQVGPLYSRLRTSTPEIVMVRQTFTAWARSIHPIIELPENASDDDKAYRDFILSDFDNMEDGFTGFSDTLVNYPPFMGFGWWEAVPGLRDPNWRPPDKGDEWQSEEDDGLLGIRRLAWRDNSTFFGWDIDDKKRLKGFIQEDFPLPQVTIELKDSLHITYGSTHNPEGQAGLEAVWRLERIRFGYEVIMGIGFEHAAGYLNVNKSEGDTLTDEDKNYVGEAAMNILTAKEGNFALWPPGIDGEVKDIPFAASRELIEAIKHYSILMLSVYMMQFIALNTMTGTGSFAAASDSSQLAILSFNGMMDGFAAQYDRQIGRRLFDWNKASFPGITKRPVIRFSHVDKNVDLKDIGNFLSLTNGILPMGEEDYKAIRAKTGFLPTALPDVTLPALPPKPTPPVAPTEPVPPVP